jgi:hypothetical protein
LSRPALAVGEGGGRHVAVAVIGVAAVRDAARGVAALGGGSGSGATASGVEGVGEGVAVGVGRAQFVVLRDVRDLHHGAGTVNGFCAPLVTPSQLGNVLITKLQDAF